MHRFRSTHIVSSATLHTANFLLQTPCDGIQEWSSIGDGYGWSPEPKPYFDPDDALGYFNIKMCAKIDLCCKVTRGMRKPKDTYKSTHARSEDTKLFIDTGCQI